MMDRADLVTRCRRILRNDPWDDNAVANAADELADLLIELTGGTPTEADVRRASDAADAAMRRLRQTIESRPLFAPAPPPKR